MSDQDYLNVITELGNLDERREGLFRKEQTYLRNKLMGGRTQAECGLCREKFPFDLLVAAHIKRRADCSNKEKRDLANVIPMCKFGCDDLFERGYVSVNCGWIRVNNQKKMTEAVREYVQKLINQKCAYLE